jgi:hypothetical protein
MSQIVGARQGTNDLGFMKSREIIGIKPFLSAIVTVLAGWDGAASWVEATCIAYPYDFARPFHGNSFLIGITLLQSIISIMKRRC